MAFFENLNWKRIFIIVGFVLVCIILAYLIYYLFFRPLAPEITPEEVIPGQLPGAVEGEPAGLIPGEEVPGELAPSEIITKIPVDLEGRPSAVAEGGITTVTDLSYEINEAITLDSDGENIISYNPDEGIFYTISPDGEKIQMTDKVYKDVQDIAWAPNKDSAVLEFPDGSNVLYNFKNDKQVTLPKDWTDFDFNQASSKIAFKDLNNIEDFRFLATANADGSGVKYLEPLGDLERDVIVDWSPNNQMIAMFKKGKNADTSEILFIGQNKENFRSLLINGYGLETQWSPSGKNLLYSAHNYYSDHKPMLHIVSAQGNNIGENHQILNVNTWAYKCDFQDDENLYCAVPQELPYGADYLPALADEIPDNIYKINLDTGVKTFIAEPAENYTVEQMQVSEDGSQLYFTDKATKSLHSIRLK